MKVSELIEKLKVMPQDMFVILSSDEEGNNFNHLRNVELSEEEPQCVILWP